MKKVFEASEAIAQGVKLSRPAVIPMYPITPQTHIVERLADYINDGELASKMIHVESEHSAMSAAIGSQATGARTFTATASQGLALMHEVLFIASGMRMPIVMAVANRALSAPINIWNDHSDSMASRDSSWIQLYIESSQEGLDTIIQAFKIGEEVHLPVMVCLDGFTLSHVWEPVDIPEQKLVDSFLPKYKAEYILDPKKPLTFGPIGFPDSFMDFKLQQQEAMGKALTVIKKANSDFKTKFGRGYGDGLIDTYKMDDAEFALVGIGTLCGTARFVVDKLREKGKKVGLIRVKCFRPFPREELKKACTNLKAIGVIDKAISFGNEGILFTELREIIPDKIVINGFIAGLGGRDIKIETIEEVFEKIIKCKEAKTGWLLS